MYQGFNILKISTSLLEKKVSIELSLDVDEDTVSLNTLILAEKETSRLVDYRISVNRRVIELELADWPVPNTEYLLKVQKGITSIIGDDLPDSLQRSLIFKSEITSAIEVLSPADHEEIEDLSIVWEEKQVQPSEDLANSYYLEVSTDTAFYNIVKKTEIIGKQEVTLSDIPSGQYFLRIRAQKDSDYGRWSNTSTFIFRTKDKHVDPEDPVYEEELSVIGVPVNGESLNSFLIEFDDDIDVDSIEEITVIRRSI